MSYSREIIFARVTADYYYPDWGWHVDFFCNLGLKNCRYDWGLNPQPYLSSQSGVFDHLVMAIQTWTLFFQYLKSGRGFKFHCQNGPLECLGNLVHSCAIKYINSPKIIMEYIRCMIFNNLDPRESGSKVKMTNNYG